ncbi:MAG: radical SAM family heme chaperone HemW [Planctomycetaceae bacterium]|nr:radical SAM family heme chaperone HemW [Planctomycetaceae bacterium]MCB9954064.1 radical SAM family heme chaperone HemW [Planctomycetaceae bacterium]
MNQASPLDSPPRPTMSANAAYIHVPFCVHKCGYCDFTVIAGRDDLADAYLEALELELKSELREPHPVETLFIGGGTPTQLAVAQLTRLLELLATWLPLRNGGEFSVEANPTGLTPEKMNVLYEGGVNRVSLGVQSFQQQELKVLERDHNPDDVTRVVAELKSAGLTNVAIDLIYAIPGQSLEHWKENIAATVALNPTHVSTYGLTFERGTKFWSRLQHGDLSRADDELERSMYAWAMDELPRQGFGQYELSNYALPGRECRHNRVYWNAEPYFGFGPGAAAFDGTKRTTRHRSTTTWIRNTLAGQPTLSDEETLTSEVRAREAVMLGLRQTAGISLSDYESTHGHSVRDLNPVCYDQFLEMEWLAQSNGHVQLTREGRFVADTVMSEFLV